MAKVIGWVNEKGGVGKSTLCFNTGWYLGASLDKKILYIDKDGQRANLSFFCNIKDRDDRKSMKDVLMDGYDINKAIVPVRENIDIIPGNVDLTEINKTVTVSTMQDAIDSIQNKYDYIFIDVNPTPTRIHILTMGVSDYIIIPMLPDVATLEANLGVIETYNLVVEEKINPKLKIMGIVFNKYVSRLNLTEDVTKVTEKMVEKLDTKLFNTKVRNNIALSENISQHIGITDYDSKCNGSIDIVALTSEILARGV